VTAQGYPFSKSDPNQLWEDSFFPPAVIGTSLCVVLRLTPNTTRPYFTLDSCMSTVSTAICEFAPPYFQDPTSRRWYKVVNAVNMRSLQSISQEFCQGEGGTLANPMGRNTLSSFSKAMRLVTDTSSVWVCGSRVGTSTTWSFCDGTVEPHFQSQ
jgi:hypothetical protein